MITIQKLVERMYIFLFPDSEEISGSFRFKLFVVLLTLLMFSTAAYTMVFIKST